MYSTILKKLKSKENKTANQIANYLGISKSLYDKYEKETEFFPIKHLNKICEYFDVSFDYIFGFVNLRNYQNNKKIINNKVFGKRLKKLRLNLYINQENIADILGVNSSTISNYENNSTNISTLNLYILCMKFNISADYLLGKIDEPKKINADGKDANWEFTDTVFIYSNLLKNLREKNNLKKEELANIIGIDVRNYRQYESEYKTIPLKYINTICNYFDVSIDYFLGLSDKVKYENYKKEIDLGIQGKNIKNLRKSLGLTLEIFAKNLDTSDSTIRNYDSGRILISTKVLYKICKKYNVSADWLLGKIEKTSLD